MDSDISAQAKRLVSYSRLCQRLSSDLDHDPSSPIVHHAVAHNQRSAPDRKLREQDGTLQRSHDLCLSLRLYRLDRVQCELFLQ